MDYELKDGPQGKSKVYPHGLDWPGESYVTHYRVVFSTLTLLLGVMHRLDKDAKANLPKDRRYIQSTRIKHDIQLILTMVPGMAKYFHDATYLVVDVTFKRVKGDFDEFNVVTNLGAHSRSKSPLSVLCVNPVLLISPEYHRNYSRYSILQSQVGGSLPAHV